MCGPHYRAGNDAAAVWAAKQLFPGFWGESRDATAAGGLPDWGKSYGCRVLWSRFRVGNVVLSLSGLSKVIGGWVESWVSNGNSRSTPQKMRKMENLTCEVIKLDLECAVNQRENWKDTKPWNTRSRG